MFDKVSCLFQETIESLRKHAIYQRRMFDQAVQLVRPGGVIVYSTLVDMPNMEVIELYSCMSIFYY